MIQWSVYVICTNHINSLNPSFCFYRPKTVTLEGFTKNALKYSFSVMKVGDILTLD